MQGQLTDRFMAAVWILVAMNRAVEQVISKEARVMQHHLPSLYPNRASRASLLSTPGSESLTNPREDPEDGAGCAHVLSLL